MNYGREISHTKKQVNVTIREGYKELEQADNEVQRGNEKVNVKFQDGIGDS